MRINYVHCYYVVIELNEFMKILDDRYSNMQAKSLASGLVAKKFRKEGSPSATVPPNDAPKWAIKTDTGEHSNYLIITFYS